jgi:hypothetical protein
MPYLKSRALADQLGITYYRLMELMRSGKLKAPQKDSSGDFVWSEDDVQRAREALAMGRRRKTGAA